MPVEDPRALSAASPSYFQKNDKLFTLQCKEIL